LRSSGRIAGGRGGEIQAAGRRRERSQTRTSRTIICRNIDAAIQTRTYVDPSPGDVEVKDFAAKWMSAQGHLKPSTRATYESILDKHVFPRWGSTPLLKVAHDDVAVWVSGLLNSGLSAATVRYVHRRTPALTVSLRTSYVALSAAWLGSPGRI
jgi:hypothetical protein